jgi:Xaa-Pro aminopeptidase
MISDGAADLLSPVIDNAIPSLPPEVYAARRLKLMEQVGPNAVVLVASQPERARNGNTMYRFRQHSDVHYLTGFDEPQAVVLLRPGATAAAPAASTGTVAAPTGTAAGGPTPPPADGRFVMFVRPRDPATEVWDGRRAGVEGAIAHYGAELAYPTDQLAERLGALLTNCDELHYAVGVDPQLDALVMATIAKLRATERRHQRPPRAIVDPMAAVHELRLHKGPEELALLRRAAAITCEAHVAAMRAGRPGVGEHELEALVDFTFRSRGGNGRGYSTIVGAGINATILHYIENRATLAPGDLVLIDAGCELDHYTADVTRTFPASGRFSPAQRAVYELVLSVQQAAIERVKPGIALDDLHHLCVRLLTDGMIRLGLLAGSREDRIADGSYRRFYMHGTSHWLGLDVHDVGAYTRAGRSRPLAPGMVITVEPGLYIADSADVPAEYRGIGVRIEDDILVTTEGHEVLTLACPKSLDDIERLCSYSSARHRD